MNCVVRVDARSEAIARFGDLEALAEQDVHSLFIK